MLAILALIAFIVAALCKIFSAHGDWISWLLIVGGLLIAAAVIAYFRGWHDRFTRPRG